MAVICHRLHLQISGILTFGGVVSFDVGLMRESPPTPLRISHATKVTKGMRQKAQLIVSDFPRKILGESQDVFELPAMTV
jgi:hypothetical protein